MQQITKKELLALLEPFSPCAPIETKPHPNPRWAAKGWIVKIYADGKVVETKNH